MTIATDVERALKIKPVTWLLTTRKRSHLRLADDSRTTIDDLLDESRGFRVSVVRCEKRPVSNGASSTGEFEVVLDTDS